MKTDFEKSALIPAVVQDARTGRVRMLGYMDRQALEATRLTGLLHLHSRSRDRLWRKGETSGNVHEVSAVSADCDGDALLVSVIAKGPTCHTGAATCFTERLWGGGPPAGVLDRLEETIAARKAGLPEGSRTAALLRAGTPRIARKVGEEAVETVVAALGESRERLVEESADLLYHLLVLWADRGVSLEEVLGALAEREGGSP
ncbi:MAG: bifunctional phosphoribosyl-AMP cyclohydrolase/phosphoribosyl-ATP diphosphatase HisIE [Acidobacteriota bacterium]